MSEPKTKTIFDHLNHLQTKQDPDYFKTLTESDRKTWSNWMVNKILSMTPEYTETINEIQRYQFLEPELYYRFLIGIIPKRKVYSKYIKRSKKDKYSEEVINFLSNYFQISAREMIEYLDILDESVIVSIYREHGFEDKEIKKLLK